MCVDGLRWQLGHGLETSSRMPVHSLWLLATPSKVVASVSEDLVVSQDMVDSIISLRLAHTLKGTCRRRH